jgi:uncharacterized OsmC-like protein
MTPDELRALQAPLKARYREEPAAAVVDAARIGRRRHRGVTCKVTTGRALVEAGLHPATGGTGLAACSGDMLLEALVACAGVTLARGGHRAGDRHRRRHRDRGGRPRLPGHAGRRQGRAGRFPWDPLSFDLRTAAPPEQVAKLVELTERYCVVYQTLAKSPPVTLTHRITR